MKQVLILSCGAFSLALCFAPQAQAQNTVGGASTGSGVGSGQRNLIWNSLYARIGGGFTNVIATGANFSTIGGGYSNAITTSNATFATIGGGQENTANEDAATIAGGFRNFATGAYATVGGGGQNEATNRHATVSGGFANRAYGIAATVGGGFGNTASATNATVVGGDGNTASGAGATVGGGEGNTASGNLSHASGFGAVASNTLAFVWSGSSVGAASTNSSSFTVRAVGGARFITATNLVGAILGPNATAWAVLSDSNAKTDIGPVNAREVLKKVAALPVTSWHYKHDLKRRYIGPMAQDFHAAFGLGGDDDKTITTLDTDGVTLAAIQGLVEEMNDRSAEIAGLRAENAGLRARLEERDQAIEARLQELSEKLDHLPPAP